MFEGRATKRPARPRIAGRPWGEVSKWVALLTLTLVGGMEYRGMLRRPVGLLPTPLRAASIRNGEDKCGGGANISNNGTRGLRRHTECAFSYGSGAWGQGGSSDTWNGYRDGDAQDGMQDQSARWQPGRVASLAGGVRVNASKLVSVLRPAYL